MTIPVVWVRRVPDSDRAAAEAARDRIESAAIRAARWPFTFRGLFTRLRARVDPTVAASAIAEGNVSAVLDLVGFRTWRDEVAEAVASRIFVSIRAAGDAARINVTPPGVPPAARFDDRGLRLRNIAGNRSARLVRYVTDTTRATIRQVVADAWWQGLNPNVAAEQLRGVVGLIPQHAAAVNRTRSRLIARGASETHANRVAARQAERLLRWRIRNIARTEALWTANTATTEWWRQLADNGWIASTSTRVWVVTDDDRLCPECAAMDGAEVALLETFTSTEVGFPPDTITRTVPIAVDYPPLHPSCRCTTVLDTGVLP